MNLGLLTALSLVSFKVKPPTSHLFQSPCIPPPILLTAGADKEARGRVYWVMGWGERRNEVDMIANAYEHFKFLFLSKGGFNSSSMNSWQALTSLPISTEAHDTNAVFNCKAINGVSK